jgi:hypothetical protein
MYIHYIADLLSVPTDSMRELLTGPFAKEQCCQIAFLIPLFLFIQDPLDDFVRFVSFLDSFFVDLVLLHFLAGRLVLWIFALESLVDSPDFGNVVFDSLEPFVILQERVELVGIMHVRVSLPFDMEALPVSYGFDELKRLTKFS